MVLVCALVGAPGVSLARQASGGGIFGRLYQGPTVHAVSPHATSTTAPRRRYPREDKANAENAKTRKIAMGIWIVTVSVARRAQANDTGGGLARRLAEH